jgi:diguanylate cyclase (GGDEF)-like protein/PAS domain S-box-containing protein
MVSQAQKITDLKEQSASDSIAEKTTGDVLSDVMDSMEQGVIVWDAEGECRLHNSRVFDMLELKQDELYVGINRKDFLQMAVNRGEFSQEVANQAMEKFKQQKPFSFSRTMPSGREIITTARSRDDGGFVVTLSDITQMKEKEAELQESMRRAEAAEAELAAQLENVLVEKTTLENQKTLLERLSMVATHAKDLVAITNSSGEVEWVNSAFSQALNYQLDEIVGQSFVDLICTNEAKPSDSKKIQECIDNRQIIRTEVICSGKTKQSFWMELEITPVFSSAGEHSNFIAVGRDTTKRKTAEMDAIEARELELQKRSEADLLSDFNGWLQSTGSLEELYDVVSAFLKQILPMSAGVVYIYANSRDVLEGVCSWNGGKMLKNFEPPDCWALRRGRCYYYGENAVDFACHHVAASHGDSPPDRHYCLPIIAHGDTVGLLSIDLPANYDSAVALETQKLANFCSEQISLAIANVQMREQLLDQSTRDGLTTLYNRRYFVECARRELARCQDKEPVSIISLDVDNFKKFNDAYGHDAGDTVLRSMGQLLLNTFRGADTPCRYGGEEFAVLIPGSDASTALEKAEELRQLVENEVVRYSGEDLNISISAGIATYPENGSTVQSLIKTADRALYAAKDSGRNTVKHADQLS